MLGVTVTTLECHRRSTEMLITTQRCAELVVGQFEAFFCEVWNWLKVKAHDFVELSNSLLTLCNVYACISKGIYDLCILLVMFYSQTVIDWEWEIYQYCWQQPRSKKCRRMPDCFFKKLFTNELSLTVSYSLQNFLLCGLSCYSI